MTGSGTAAGSTPAVIDYESGGGRGGGSKDRLAQDQRTERPADCAAFLAWIATAGDSHAPNYWGDTQENYHEEPLSRRALTEFGHQLSRVELADGGFEGIVRRHQSEGGFMSLE